MKIVEVDRGDPYCAYLKFDNGGTLEIYMDEMDAQYELFVNHPNRNSDLDTDDLRSYAKDYEAVAWLMEQFGIEKIEPGEGWKDGPHHTYPITEHNWRWIKDQQYDKKD